MYPLHYLTHIPPLLVAQHRAEPLVMYVSKFCFIIYLTSIQHLQLIIAYRAKKIYKKLYINTQFYAYNGSFYLHILKFIYSIYRLCYTITNERSLYENIGIICEYNPFHNGHAHQLHTLHSYIQMLYEFVS